MQIHEHVMLEDDSNFDHSQTCAIKLDASTSHMLKKTVTISATMWLQLVLTNLNTYNNVTSSGFFKSHTNNLKVGKHKAKANIC